MYLAYSPLLLRLLFPSLIWRLNNHEKVIYFTFDDGPIPDVTPFVLKTLAEFSAKATFFCIGDNITKHPEIFQQVRAAGHSIGNHTYNHLNGWKTPTKTYIENISTCQQLTRTDLFRPPYGRITPLQIRAIRNQLNTQRIVMWDVLSGDFDPRRSPETCLDSVIKHTRKGSIIVFHDSLKAFKNLQYALPRALSYFAEKGYRFEAL